MKTKKLLIKTLILILFPAIPINVYANNELKTETEKTEKIEPINKSIY